MSRKTPDQRARELAHRRQLHAMTQYGGAALPPGPESRVRVQLAMDDETKVYYYRVKVDSRVSPGRVMHIDIPVKAAHLDKQVALAAGAMCEEMNIKYKDALCPERMAKMALEAFSDLQHKLNTNGGFIGVNNG